MGFNGQTGYLIPSKVDFTKATWTTNSDYGHILSIYKVYRFG